MPGPVPRANIQQCSSLYWESVGWLQGWCGKPTGHEGWLEWSYFCSEEYMIQSLCKDTFHWLGVILRIRIYGIFRFLLSFLLRI